MVSFSFLSEYTELAEMLGREIYREWESMYRVQGKTESDVVATVKSRAVDNEIPLTMIAHENGALCGSVTLKVNEGDEFPELTPWLAGVFVLPQFRGKGIGRSLVTFAEMVASEKFGVRKLYLYTSTAAGLYSALGYCVFAQAEKDGKVVEYMEKELC